MKGRWRWSMTFRVLYTAGFTLYMVTIIEIYSVKPVEHDSLAALAQAGPSSTRRPGRASRRPAHEGSAVIPPHPRCFLFCSV
jgi:hypothetical protein